MKAPFVELLPTIAEREQADPETYPAANVADLLAVGFHSGPFSSADGAAWSLADSTAAVEQLAAASPSAALLLSMPLGLAGNLSVDIGAVPPPFLSGWQEQADRIAARYRQGAIYAACNSEKGAGGSLDATKTLAGRNGDGHWRLNGEKILASSGANASRFFSTGKVTQEDLPGAGVVEFFFVEPSAPGVEVLDDWDGFGMRSTESQTVRYTDAHAEEMLGFPNYIAVMQPLQYWFCLFAAIPLGCANAILSELGSPAPASPALRLRFSEALMRIEAMRGYLHQTASAWRPGAGPAYAARVLRTKTYVTQEATKLSAELFALAGGRHYRRNSPVARRVADAFAGTALRPPLALALDALVEQFSLDSLESP